MKLFPALGRLLLGAAAACMIAGSVIAADKSIIVFDASGSMWAQIDGKTRIEIAREAIRRVIGALPLDKEIGLIAYGHREKGSCTDIELLVAPAAGSSAAIIAATDRITPRGKTPLSEGVKRAADALKYTEEKATVILVTDGLETCNADPCALGKALEAAGVDFTAHVIGFGLSEEEGKQVACLAINTGGKYIQASDADQLTEAFRTTVVTYAPKPAPATIAINIKPTVVLAQGGDAVADEFGVVWEFYEISADGSKGKRINTVYGDYQGYMPAGDYILSVRADKAYAERRITLSSVAILAPVFILNAGSIQVTPYTTEGAEPNGSAAVEYSFEGGETTKYGPNRAVLPAGNISIEVRLGKGNVIEKLILKAGDRLVKKVFVGTGRVLAHAYYVEGEKIDANGMALEIYSAEEKLDGSRKKIANHYGADAKFDLPPGDYVLLGKIGAARGEAAFQVIAGELVTLKVVLNAGILKVKAPGNHSWRILSAKKSLSDHRDALTNGFGEAIQTTLNAGDYVLETKNKGTGKTTLTPVTIKAGKPMELTVQ